MLFRSVWKDALGDVKFFQPVFNIADSAISIGVASILLFQRHYFNDDKPETDEENTTVTTETVTEAVDTEGVNDTTKTMTDALDNEGENDTSEAVANDVSSEQKDGEQSV